MFGVFFCGSKKCANNDTNQNTQEDDGEVGRAEQSYQCGGEMRGRLVVKIVHILQINLHH